MCLGASLRRASRSRRRPRRGRRGSRRSTRHPTNASLRRLITALIMRNVAIPMPSHAEQTPRRRGREHRGRSGTNIGRGREVPHMRRSVPDDVDHMGVAVALAGDVAEVDATVDLTEDFKATDGCEVEGCGGGRPCDAHGARGHAFRERLREPDEARRRDPHERRCRASSRACVEKYATTVMPSSDDGPRIDQRRPRASVTAKTAPPEAPRSLSRSIVGVPFMSLPDATAARGSRPRAFP